MLSTTFISKNLKRLDIKDIDLKMAQGTKENDDERSFKALMGKRPFKILLLGDTYVGKSTLLQNLISGEDRMTNCAEMENEYMPTIGIDFKRKVRRILVIHKSQERRKIVSFR